MSKHMADDHVLPRPVERLPEYAHARARQALGEKLTDTFGLSPASAITCANAVVDPSEVRKSIGEPSDPGVERISVPGGTLLGIRTSVWAKRIMPDPRNPRTLPSRRHPFAIEPGTGAEDSKFRPIPEPRPLDAERPRSAELAVDVENRHHLTWAAQQAAAYVLAENDWTRSISSQGVMEAVWLVLTTYQHRDGSAPATALVTAEGSSRCTAVHKLLGVRSADVPYDDNEAKRRADVRKLNEAFDRGVLSEDQRIALRCERVPALILVGFAPHASGKTEFPTAVKSLVALRHVDPPKPWGEGPENESLADEVLDELYRRDLISATERDYFAGSCTRSEAKAAHLPSDPVLRAAKLVELFSGSNEMVNDAIRVAVTSQSTRKRITSKLMNDLATALILRAVAEEPAKVDQIRRYLRHAFGKSVHGGRWQSTGRTTDQLVRDAIAEVSQMIRHGASTEPGASSLELAVRAAYPLIVSGRLNADRGTSGNDQPDRRTPSEVLDAMRSTFQGVHQLGQALRDFATDKAIRAVDEDGEIRLMDSEDEPLTVNDVYLRREFPPPGKAKAPRPGDTPTDHYNRALDELGNALAFLDRAFLQLTAVRGDDDQSLVEGRGVDVRLVQPWRSQLKRIDDDMTVWERTFRKKHGSKVGLPSDLTEPEYDEADLDPYADVSPESEDDWRKPMAEPEAPGDTVA